jgi:hypothetical protein
MRKNVRLSWLLLPVLWLCLGLWNFNYAQLSQINNNGGFESSLPSYWTIGNAPSGATLTWATDQSRSMGHSLEIVKPVTTADSAAWVSTNMCDLWSPRHYSGVDIMIGGWVRTSGVNVNPATDDQKWYISYTFYDSAGAKIGAVKLPINQSVASSSGWVADTNAVGQLILPKDSWKTIIAFVAGKNATGTVWGDDFILVGRNGGWAGQDWNTGADMPTFWNYWLPPNGGNDGLLNSGFENTTISGTEAHSGTHSLKFDLPISRAPHDAWVGTKRTPLDANIHAGDVLRISVWIKASGLYPDSARNNIGTWSVGLTPIFHSGYLPNDPYDEIGAHDYVFTFPDTAHSFDWNQYTLDITVPPDANAKNFSVRIHPYSRMVGTLYFDDLRVDKLTNVTSINDIGGFEGTLPSYWTKGNEPAGATLTWATDQSRSMGHSLKIVKPSVTSDTAAWVSTNMCDLWSPRHYSGVDIMIGGYVRTSGVNVNPATDDQKWYISYTFYDSAGAKIGAVKLPINQSVASSSGWVADTNAVGQLILPKDSWKTIIAFVAGKNATGTVWGDDFILVGRNGGWAGQDWNTGADMPTGWNYWLPPNGGNDGLLNSGFENTKLTTEAFHSGTSSLKFDLPITRAPHDAWVGTLRYPLDANVHANSVLRVSVWIKASGLYPDSARNNLGTWSVGLTPIFHSGYLSNDAYDEIGAHDYVFAFPDTAHSFDWTQYSLDVTVPTDVNAKNFSVRIHPYSRMVGTLYFDDLEVKLVGTTGINGPGNIIPADFYVYQNYPNPFNPSTTIRYNIPQSANVSVKIYNMLGQEIKTLFAGNQNVGSHSVIWNGDTNFGTKAASGTYIFIVKYNSQFQVKKMILLK